MTDWKSKPWWMRHPMVALTLFLAVVLPICYLAMYRMGSTP